MFTSWLMVNASGVDQISAELGALKDPTTFLFGLSDRYVGGWLTQIMNVLFVSSLFAGVVAFHNGVARYMYVAGREKLLPASIGVMATVDGHWSLPVPDALVREVLAAS